MKSNQMIRVGILAILAGILASCSSIAGISPTSTPTISAEPRVFFTNIKDGDTVSSPVHLEWGAENFTIESYGEVHENAGHLHVLIDNYVTCIAPGEQIRNPEDGSQRHYLLGQVEADIELTPGVHTLCLQAGNGEHIALPGDGMTQVISIIVEE